MRRTFAVAIAAALMGLFALEAFADQYVRGYTQRDGTYVAPHYRSFPNSTTLDNWSTRGNTNPYTGQPGTRDPSPSYGSRSYGSDSGSLLGGSRRRY